MTDPYSNLLKFRWTDVAFAMLTLLRPVLSLKRRPTSKRQRRMSGSGFDATDQRRDTGLRCCTSLSIVNQVLGRIESESKSPRKEGLIKSLDCTP
ncbi:uncharacterized protein BKA78DRAFT_36907 [Phyllosticta capitalensis]|uniref:uncharacterized protein n=1 Tax=Phyllosticta capitalensis TaxID=121624 RepID=UPI003131F45A